MLRMRYVVVVIAALALVLLAVGVASAQGEVAGVVNMVIPLSFNSFSQSGTGLGWIGYSQDTAGSRGWDGNFNFQNLKPNTTYTVKGSSSSGWINICSFTTNGLGAGGCWMPSPWPTWTGLASPVTMSWSQSTGGFSSSCSWPSIALYDSSGMVVLTAYRTPFMSATCVASQMPTYP